MPAVRTPSVRKRRPSRRARAASASAAHAANSNIPAEADAAIARVEHLFVHGTDTQYAQSLEQLAAACVGLSQTQRIAIEHELAAAKTRAEDAAHLARMRAALAGPWTLVRELPGDVELVSLQGGPDEQLLVAVPALRPDASAMETFRVTQARHALARGECPRCGAELSMLGPDQLGLRHQDRCPLSDRNLRAR